MDPFVNLFVSNILSNFLWGFYTCVFLATLCVMKARKAGFTPAVIAICVLYCLNFAASIVQLYMSLPSWSQFAGGADETWANINTSAPNAISDLCLFLSIIVADTTMSWRMWIIWSKDFRVLILPVIALCFGVVGGCFIVAYDCMGVINHIDAYLTWSESMLAGTAALNIFVTCMTVGKLWWVSRKVRKLCPASQTSNRYEAFISAVVESGVMYTICTIIFAVLLRVNLDARLIFQGIFFYNIGIAPTLILLKLSMGYLQPGDSVNMSAPSGQLIKSQSLAAPSSRPRRDDLSCDLSDLDSRDNTASQMTETKDHKYDLESPTTTLEGRDSRLQIYVDTKANTHIV